MATFKLLVEKLLDDAANTHWPWKDGGRQVKHLSANDLMRHSASLLNFAGRNQLAGRLVYYAILKDAHQIDALIMMSDFLAAGDSAHFSIDLKPYAAAVLEYALVTTNHISAEQKAQTKAARLKLMVRLGHAALKTSCAPSEKQYYRPDLFTIDELAYISYVMPSVCAIGSLTDAFQLAHAFLGVYAGLVDYQRQTSRTEQITLKSFERSRVYYRWLRSDPEVLVQSYLGRKK